MIKLTPSGKPQKYKKYVRGRFVPLDQQRLHQNHFKVSQFIGIAPKRFDLFFLKITIKDPAKSQLKKFEGIEVNSGITDAVSLASAQDRNQDYFVYGVLLEDKIVISR